ncbi:MAG: dethiobiotin synthase [Nitrospiraceae bacterium]|nr:dethiobiotin synthase [Nitrospiraceae bacterium]
MSRGIFITGTDTGVGKTWIAAGIAQAFRTSGIDVGVMKPAETGCRTRRGELIPSDALILSEAAGTNDALGLVNPYRFRLPLAPAVAASQEGKRIDMKRILTCYRELQNKHAWMVVEGAGGILVPLTSRLTYLDLAAALGLPVLVVARPGLGTINHTLLTIMALRSRKMPIAGIVFNDSSGGARGLAERSSSSVIERIAGVSILGSTRFGQKDLSSVARQLLRGI